MKVTQFPALAAMLVASAAAQQFEPPFRVQAGGIVHWTKAVQFTESEVQQHPARQQVRERLRESTLALAQLLYGAWRYDAAADAADRAIAAAEALDAKFPSRALLLANTLVETSNAAYAAQHFERYERLDARLARVAGLLAGDDSHPARRGACQGAPRARARAHGPRRSVPAG